MRFTPRGSLRKATTFGLGLIVLMLTFDVFVSRWNVQRLLENEHRVLQTQEVLTTLEEVLAHVTEAETGERGFLITGDSDYLHSYQAAVENTRVTLGHLQDLISDDKPMRARIAMLEDRVRVRFDELRRAIAAQQTEGFDAAKRSVSTNQGRQLMNEMRKLVAEIQRLEQSALEIWSRESVESAQVTTFTNFAGASVGIGLVVLAFFLFRRELIHRRRADEAQRRLAAIVESSDDAIVSKTLDGMISSWNAGAARIYGYAAEEVLGRPIALLSPPERVDEIQSNLERVQDGVPIESIETTRLCKDGRRIDVSLSISPIKDEDGKVIGASAIARDVSEHRLLQREVLEIAAREQQRIGQDLHDGTGQELTALAMMTQRLTGELAEQSLPQARTAARIVEGMEEALRHVRDLSKGLVPVEVDAEGLMVALTDLAARTSESHGIACAFQCDEPVRILDNQTATHLYRLSQEAVNNAIKHGRPENIVISLTSRDDFITLKIADDGSGLNENGQPAPGTGLRIMRYRAELIRAKLTITRLHPHGTQVVCMLPRHQDSWQNGLARMGQAFPMESDMVDAEA